MSNMTDMSKDASTTLLSALLIVTGFALVPFFVAQAQEQEEDPVSNTAPAPLLEPVQNAPASSPSTDFLSEMRLSAALDLYGLLPVQNVPLDGDRFRVRGAEISVHGPVDSLFDALVNFAGHDEVEEFEIALREGYVGSTKLIPASRFRLGKFLLGVGRLNQFHRHDWPFISAPMVQERFFGEEGVADSGAEYSLSLSELLSTDFHLDLTIGITNGYCFGNCPVGGGGQKPLTPTHYLHPVFFTSFGNDGDGSDENGHGSGAQLGLTYLARTDHTGERMRIVGADFTYKKRQGPLLVWLLQGEVYHRYLQPAALPLSEEVGAYFYAQRALDERWAAGVRLDAFTIPSLRLSNGEKRSNLNSGFVPIVAYKASELSTVRFAYTYFTEAREGDTDRIEQRFELQLVAVLGSHPTHDF